MSMMLSTIFEQIQDYYYHSSRQGGVGLDVEESYHEHHPYYDHQHHHGGIHRSLQTEALMADDVIGEGIIDDDIDDEEDVNKAMQLSYAILTNAFLFFLIFGLSATVQVGNLQHQLTNKLAICTGVAMQFLIMPVLGFLAVLFLQGSGFTQPMGMTLLVVTASPGGSYSNWWCSLFNAELALSVAMTSVSSILSIGLLPLNLFVYTWLAYTAILPDKHRHGSDGEDGSDGSSNTNNIFDSLEFGPVFISLGVVLAAILSGLYTGYKFDNPTFHKRANAFGSLCGVLLILFSVFLSSGTGGSSVNFFNLPWSFYVGTAFPCIVGMALANVLSRFFRLSPPECVAISIECCYQNTAIATSVAVTMFSNPDEQAAAVSVPLMYGMVEAVIIGLYCVWAWKVGWTKAPKDENICIVVTKTYEVHEDGELYDGGENNTSNDGSPGIPVADLTKKQTTTAKDDDEEDENDEIYDLEQDKRTAQTNSTSTITTAGTMSTRSGDTINKNGQSKVGPLLVDGSAGAAPSSAATSTPGGGTGGDRDRFYSADATSTSTPATAPITPMTPGNRSLDEFPSPTPPRQAVRVRLDLEEAGGEQQQQQQQQENDRAVATAAAGIMNGVAVDMENSFAQRTKTPVPPNYTQDDLPKPPSGRGIEKKDVGQELVVEEEQVLYDLDESFSKPPSSRSVRLVDAAAPSDAEKKTIEEDNIYDLDESFPKPPSGRKVFGAAALGDSSVFASSEEC